MEFRSKYDEHEHFYSEPGSPERVIYAPEIGKDHQIVVEKKGTENFYAYINSHADSVDINVLMARFANGDKEALNQRVASYMDVSKVPNNMNDFVNLSRKAASFFDTLPVEVKQKFDNNVLKFTSMIGTPEMDDALNTSEYLEKKKIVQESAEMAQKLKDEIQHATKVMSNPGTDVPKTEGGDIS